MQSWRLNKAWWGFPRRHPAWTSVIAVLALIMIGLALVNWNWLRRPVERLVTQATGRELRIEGDLDVDFIPLEVHAEKIRFANATWSETAEMARVESLHARVRFWPLLAGRLTLPLLQVGQPRLHLERNAEGTGNWVFGTRRRCDPPGCKSRVRILQLLARDGSMRFREPALKTAIDLQFDSVKPSGKDALAPLVLQGKGTYRDAPFKLSGRVDSPLALQDPKRPYQLDLSAEAGEMKARMWGALPEPLRLQDVEVNFELRGSDLAQLDRFAGIVLPTTPPYELRGVLSRNGETFSYREFKGKVGDSDLSGDAEVDFSGTRPRLTAELKSKLLDFDDLAGFVGGTPAAGEGETASAEQQKAADERRASGKVLPSNPIELARLRAMDADVKLTAERINSPRLPLESMQAHLKMDDGVLTIEPLQFGAAGGRLTSKVRLDARKDPALLALDMDVRSLELPKLMPKVEKMKDSLGSIAGTIQLQGTGNSASSILGSSSGAMSVIMGQGQISNLMLEVAGLDVAEILKFLIGKDQQVLVRCAYADFALHDGVAEARAVGFDTTDTALLMTGDFSFREETLDLKVLPRPKDASPLSVRSPIKVGGTFADPQVGVDAGPLLVRGGAVAALVAIAPPLGLLALIETGEGKDTDCGRSIGDPEAEEQRNGDSSKKERSPQPGPRPPATAS